MPIDAVGRRHVKPLAHEQRVAAGHLVREDAQLIAHVEAPEDVGIVRRRRDRRLTRAGGVLGLIEKRPLVAIGHPRGIQAQHFAAIGDQVNAVAFGGVLDGRGGAEACFGIVADVAGRELWGGQLPEQPAGGFVQAEKDAVIAFVAGVARRGIVGADVNSSTGDSDIAPATGAELCRPFDVPGRGRVDLIAAILSLTDVGGERQALLGRHHVARGVAAPHGAIAGPGNAEGQRGGQRAENQKPCESRLLSPAVHRRRVGERVPTLPRSTERGQ